MSIETERARLYERLTRDDLYERLDFEMPGRKSGPYPELGGRLPCRNWKRARRGGMVSVKKPGFSWHHFPANCHSWECKECSEGKRIKLFEEVLTGWRNAHPSSRPWLVTLTCRTKRSSEDWDDFDYMGVVDPTIEVTPHEGESGDSFFRRVRATHLEHPLYPLYPMRKHGRRCTLRCCRLVSNKEKRDRLFKRKLATALKAGTGWRSRRGKLWTQITRTRRNWNGDAWALYYSGLWKVLSLRFKKKYGEEIERFSAYERTKEDVVHCHGLLHKPDGVDPYDLEMWLRSTWQDLTLDSTEVYLSDKHLPDGQLANMRSLVWYPFKYISKEFRDPERYAGMRKYSRSNAFPRARILDIGTLSLVNASSGELTVYNHFEYTKAVGRMYYWAKVTPREKWRRGLRQEGVYLKRTEPAEAHQTAFWHSDTIRGKKTAVRGLWDFRKTPESPKRSYSGEKRYAGVASEDEHYVENIRRRKQLQGVYTMWNALEGVPIWNSPPTGFWHPVAQLPDGTLVDIRSE